MDIRKVIQIALRGAREIFSNRSLLLIMIAAPLLITLVIGAAFSQFLNNSGDIPISTIPIAVVNHDAGTPITATILGVTTNLFTLNMGDQLTKLLTDPPADLKKLIDAKVMNEDDAKALVNQGKLVAVIIIPANFSAALNPSNSSIGQTTITLYRDSGSPISASIMSSVIHNYANSFAGGFITLFAARDVDQQLFTQLEPQLQQISQDFGAKLQSNPAITVQDLSNPGQPNVTSNPLQYFAPSMAIFFILFTSVNGAGSIFDEKQEGTLQRLLITPTTRLTIMLGKIGGVMLTCLFQLTILILAMPLIGRVLGSKESVWGSNLFGIALLSIATALAATGLGTFLVGISKDKQQNDTLANVIPILVGAAGGAFFDVSSVPVLSVITRFTPNYWATTGFRQLAVSGDLVSVLPNILILLMMFIVLFGIGVTGFSRHTDI